VFVVKKGCKEIQIKAIYQEKRMSIKVSNKETYLAGFEENKGENWYAFIISVKWIGWLLFCVIAFVMIVLPKLPSIIIMGIVSGMICAFQQSEIYWLMNSWVFQVAFVLVTSLLIVIEVFLYIQLAEKRSYVSVGLQNSKRQGRGSQRIKTIGIGLVTAFIMQFLYIMIMLALGWLEPVRTLPIAQDGRGTLAALAFILFGFFVQSFGEELILRGWLIQVLSHYYSYWVGILAATVIFCIIHLNRTSLNSVIIINLVLYGIFAGLYALNDGNLWGIIVNHSVLSWIVSSMFGTAIGKVNLGQASLMAIRLKGPRNLTGGSSGPEGSLIYSAIILIGIIILLSKLFKKGTFLVWKDYFHEVSAVEVLKPLDDENNKHVVEEIYENGDKVYVYDVDLE